MMPGVVGLIVNPMAGRDIRRVVAAASLQSSPEKLLAVRRILAGIAAVPGIRVVMPDDREGFSDYVASEVRSPVRISLAKGPDGDAGALTMGWVGALQSAGAGVLVVVGGDGTQRNAAQGLPAVPVLPVAGGTNNVACWTGDQTVAGYAAALYLARSLDPASVGQRAKIIHVRVGGHEDMALIDVALVRQPFTGALAVWRADDVEALILGIADPARPGLSNVGGFVSPLRPEDDFGLFMALAADDDEVPGVPTVLVPGLMATMRVRGFSQLAFGQTVSVSRPAGGTLALDGERTVVLHRGETAEVWVQRDGPYVLDPVRVLTASPAYGIPHIALHVPPAASGADGVGKPGHGIFPA
ncbi:MAG: ATP-NAD kinase [Thermaerobacter sp.]|nr:ATP-NAD kinase [Thermaerobacter sp.]